MNSQALTTYELNSLYSILNAEIVERARSALSSLLGEQINHNIKSTHIQISEIENNKKFSNDLILYSIFLSGKGDVRLGILFTLREPDARKIAANLLCVEKIEILDDMGKSALSEVGNIISGSFFNAVSDVTGLKVELSTPSFATVSGKTILRPHASDFIQADEDMVTQVELSGQSSGIIVQMLIIQDSDTARKLLNTKK
jgi:chemotaxis protein CheC